MVKTKVVALAVALLGPGCSAAGQGGAGSSGSFGGAGCTGSVTVELDQSLEPCAPLTLSCTLDGASVENTVMGLPPGLVEFDCYITIPGKVDIYAMCFPPAAVVECGQDVTAFCIAAMPLETPNGTWCYCPYPNGC